MSDGNVTPFGEYGILIRDIRQSNICPTDMSKIKDAEYLFQRGCSFDIYKWDGDRYTGTLRFDGKDYSKLTPKDTTAKPPFSTLVPMHIWLNGMEELQRWLGQYYESAIATMLAPEAKKKPKDTSDVEDTLNELFKKQYPYSNPMDDWDDGSTKVNPWDYNKKWTTTYTSKTIDDLNNKIDNMVDEVSKWKAVK